MPLVVRAIQALSRDTLEVGIPRDGAPRDDPDEPSNAQLGYMMETGVPERNIPPRPFLGPGLQDARPEVVATLRRAAGQALRDTVGLRGTTNGSAILRGLNEAGLAAAEAVRARVETGPFIPLADRTVARRRARGQESTAPLLDTEQMYDAITYRIRPKER